MREYAPRKRITAAKIVEIVKVRSTDFAGVHRMTVKGDDGEHYALSGTDGILSLWVPKVGDYVVLDLGRFHWATTAAFESDYILAGTRDTGTEGGE